MSTEKIKKQLETLQPLLDLSNFALKPPNESAKIEHLTSAEEWLDALITDFHSEFTVIYTQPHTGDTFWETVASIGIPEGEIMSDLQPCVNMRNLLKAFKRRLVKNLPILFGGIEHGKSKTKKKPRGRDSEGTDQIPEDTRLAGASPTCGLQEQGMAGLVHNSHKIRPKMGGSKTARNGRKQVHKCTD